MKWQRTEVAEINITAVFCQTLLLKNENKGKDTELKELLEVLRLTQNSISHGSLMLAQGFNQHIPEKLQRWRKYNHYGLSVPMFDPNEF